MYRNILIPVAFEDNSKAEAAIDIAGRLSAPGAKITLLHVMEDLPGYVTTYFPADFKEQTENSLKAKLETLATEIDGGVPVLIHGHAAVSILDYADQNETDCIVVASHRPGMQDYLLGSTAAKIVRHAKCNVHVLR